MQGFLFDFASIQGGGGGGAGEGRQTSVITAGGARRVHHRNPDSFDKDCACVKVET